ncbi:hypothetical protein GGR56DRAFT_654577 [Xylariaceae sp. FL0804]|nr:hypothetical protein GGR56DRAFT_654577 [Xylariaceae sp. FL0804]
MPLYDDQYNSQCFFEAAEALGVSLVIFDNPGHWLWLAEDERWAHLREEFIALEMDDFAQLPQAMVDALRSRGRAVDGIVTFTDVYLIAAAQAAEMMGLPTEPSRAMIQAAFKHKFRSILADEGGRPGNRIRSLHLDRPESVDDPARAAEIATLEYPLIVKPCRGLYSKWVKKVHSLAELREAARALSEDDALAEQGRLAEAELQAEQGILVETYVDGPEVDANFLLWDGEIRFFEVVDNFPCRGDAGDATLAEDFAETLCFSPSGLPPAEVDAIRRNLREDILRLGFRSGMFHAEARVRNSSMRYEEVRGGDGVMMDLVPVTRKGSGGGGGVEGPDVFAIELNVRSPGTGGTWFSLLTLGVDLGAAQILRALDDGERFDALAKPYAFPDSVPFGPSGAQYWGSHCGIPIHRDNIRVPDDFFGDLWRELPDVKPYLARAEMHTVPGSVVSPDGGVGWVCYVLVYSRTSRAHAVEMYYRIAAASKKVLDAELTNGHNA